MIEPKKTNDSKSRTSIWFTLEPERTTLPDGEYSMNNSWLL